jgi:hypothetical protein
MGGPDCPRTRAHRNVCQRRSGRKSVMSRVYSVANWTEFRRTPKMRRKRKPGVTLGGIIHRGRNRSRFVEQIWLRRTHISFSRTTPLISDRVLNIPITPACPWVHKASGRTVQINAFGANPAWKPRTARTQTGTKRRPRTCPRSTRCDLIMSPAKSSRNG